MPVACDSARSWCCVIVSSSRFVMHIIERNPALTYPRDIQQEKRLIVLFYLSVDYSEMWRTHKHRGWNFYGTHSN